MAHTNDKNVLYVSLLFLCILSVPGILSKGSSGSQKARLTPSHPHSHNSSITASPFNADILQALGHQQMTTPTNNSVDILDDSLGMLSTVALLDSEMSDVNMSAGTSVQERLAGMKITSHHGIYVLVPYSRKLSREKTFTNFMVLEPPAKVFSSKFGCAVPTYNRFKHSAKVFSVKWSLLIDL